MRRGLSLAVISSRCAAVLFSYFGLTIVASPVWGATFMWEGDAGAVPPNGFYGNPGNWDPATIPAVGDDVELTLADTYTITLAADRSVDRIFQRGGNVNLLSNIATPRKLQLTSGSADFVVRDGGTLNLGSAANPIFVTVGDQMPIGTGTGSGSVFVTGEESRLDALGTGIQSIGSSGFVGALTVADGATANYGVNGTLELGISGIATSQGTVNVSGGSTMNTGHVLMATVDSLAAATMTVSGNDSLIEQTLADANLAVGSGTSGIAILDVQSGAQFITSTGTTTINATGTVNVGIVGDGTFNANGDVNVDGGTLNVGEFGTEFILASGKKLTASNGGMVDLDQTYDIKNDTTFEIRSGATLVADHLDVGFDGNGTLIVDGSNSSVSAGFFGLWGARSNTANITLRNGAMGAFNDIFLAPSGNGTVGNFSVETGGTVVARNIEIADQNTWSTAGTLNVDGINSSLTQMNGATLDVGNVTGPGTGTINVQNGGTYSTGTGTIEIRNTGAVNVGLVGAGTLNANGPVDLAGGTVAIAGGGTFHAHEAITIGSAGAINLSGGELNATTIDHTAGGQFNFTGGSLSVDTVEGDLTNQGGTLSPGSSPGTTTITGNYDQQTGSLAIELGGLAPGTEYDEVEVLGVATLGGTLEVELINGFTPSEGDMFEILTAADVQNTFAIESFPALVDLHWSIDYGATSVVLSVVAGLAGDYNDDGIVDAADYTVWRDNLGAAAGTLPNDIDGGAIGQAQYDTWVADFGATGSGATSTIAAVPEPAGLFLALVGCLTAICIYRRSVRK